MLSSSWKRDFASGLIVLVPLIITAYVIAYLYGILASAPFIPAINAEVFRAVGLPAYDEFVQFARVMTTVIVFVLLVLSFGYLMRTAFGDFVEAVIDNVMNRLPGLRVVYNASKMAVETAVSGTDDLQTPVKIETWNGLRMTAFKTGKSTTDGRDVLFLPTAPNITTGFVVEVDPEDYEEIDERVEEALTRILSAGFGESREDRIDIPVTPETEDGEESPAGDD